MGSSDPRFFFLCATTASKRQANNIDCTLDSTWQFLIHVLCRWAENTLKCSNFMTLPFVSVVIWLAGEALSLTLSSLVRSFIMVSGVVGRGSGADRFNDGFHLMMAVDVGCSVGWAVEITSRAQRVLPVSVHHTILIPTSIDFIPGRFQRRYQSAKEVSRRTLPILSITH